MIKNYNRDILDWKRFPTYSWIWCDPPWEQRMTKWFQTLLKKDSGKEVNHTITEILEALASKADNSKPLFIEYSEKGSEYVIEVMKKFGHQFYWKSTHVQTTGSPFVLMCFNQEFEKPSPTDKGFNILKNYVKRYRPKIIFDPFAGIGNTAKAINSCNAGTIYIGSEINPKRFQKLKQRNP